MEKRLHFVKWAIVCSDKKKGGLGVKNLFILIGPFSVSGVGAMRLRGSPYGSLLLVGSLERKEEGGVPMK